MSQLSASPIRMADSTARRLTAGMAPGRPRQVGQTWVLGSAPNSVGQPQNILDAVLSSTCTSRPRAGSYAASASSYGIRAAVVVLVEVVIGQLRSVRGPSRAVVRPRPARAA